MKRNERRKLHLQKTRHGEFVTKSCKSKKPYNSEIEALSWGRFANERYKHDIKYSAYFCKFCEKWHLTSIKDEKL